MKLTLLVDDAGTLYVDGQLVAQLSFFQLTEEMLPAKCKCIAVYVTNMLLTIGIIAETSTKMVTDTTWKCTAMKPSWDLEWTTPEYDDSAWPNAVQFSRNDIGRALVSFIPQISPNVYWITVADSTSPVMYCRKTLNGSRPNT